MRIYCANKIPNCISESCATEIQPLIARVCFQITPQAHKPVPHLQLWSRNFGRSGVSLFPHILWCLRSQRSCSSSQSLLPTRLWCLCSERSCSSPQGTQGCSPQQPSPLPARVSGSHFPPSSGLTQTAVPGL